jgi:hypothetical protein
LVIAGKRIRIVIMSLQDQEVEADR